MSTNPTDNHPFTDPTNPPERRPNWKPAIVAGVVVLATVIVCIWSAMRSDDESGASADTTEETCTWDDDVLVDEGDITYGEFVFEITITHDEPCERGSATVRVNRTGTHQGPVWEDFFDDFSAMVDDPMSASMYYRGVCIRTEFDFDLDNPITMADATVLGQQLAYATTAQGLCPTPVTVAPS